MFAHNGWLPDIHRSLQLGLGHYCPVGETDSEHAFCALLQRMLKVWRTANAIPPLEHRLSVVVEFAAELRTLGPANFLYSDGDTYLLMGIAEGSSPPARPFRLGSSFWNGTADATA